MMKTLITTTVLTLGLGFFSAPSFASNYIVNGHAASPAEAQVLVASGVQQGAWVVNGYGIAPAERTSFTAPAAKQAKLASRSATTFSMCCSATVPASSLFAGHQAE